ncbi:MAG: methyltransferase domain-containing protein [Bacteroidota bacterium]
MNLSQLSVEQGVFQLSSVSSPQENLYQKIRLKENRVYSDAEVKEFPETFFYNLHRQEWESRKRSQERLLKYLRKQGPKGSILEIGCGMGWLIHSIARQLDVECWGVDRHQASLEQAARVLVHPKLKFGMGDPFKDLFPAEYFQTIILAATIEYFPNLASLINRARHYVVSGGEIHILDSPIYQDREIEKAQQTKMDYLTQLGIHTDEPLIHCHQRSDFQAFDYQYLYRPASGMGKWFKGGTDPYPWIKIIN